MSLFEWSNENGRLSKATKLLEQNNFSNLSDDLNTELKELIRHRKSTTDTTKKRLLGLKMNLQDIMNRLGNITHFNSNSGSIQQTLETFESKLSSYKSTMRAEYDVLIHDESVLESDLQNILSKIDAWENDSNYTGTQYNKSRKPKQRAEAEAKSRRADRYERHLQLQGQIGALDRQVCNAYFYSRWRTRVIIIVFR